MQQDEVMSELPEYAKMDPSPEDSCEVLATESYLRALNNIFERTLLGKKTRIFQALRRTLASLGFYMSPFGLLNNHVET